MHASEAPTRALADPLAPLEHIGHWLLGAAAHLLLGLAGGALAARAMRRRHIHWSWALVVLMPIAIARPLLGGWATTLAVAAIAAACKGRRWHREDLEAGRDLALIARKRRTPVEVLAKALASAAARVRPRRLLTPESAGADQLALGRDVSGRVVSIPFAADQSAAHTLVLGATGSGKTMTQAWIAHQAIARGMGAVVVDPKGDPALRGALLQAACDCGKPFIEWTPEGPSVYNPFARGSDTAIADKVLAGERFTEPHYQRQAQRYLGHVARALRASGTAVSLARIVEHLDPSCLEGLARALPQSRAQATHDYLDSLTTRQRSELSGVRDRLAILSESDVGRWLDPAAECGQAFDLLEAVQMRAVVYFDMDADSRPLLTQMLGAAIVQDLQATVAALQGRPLATLVAIDEFSAVAAGGVVSLFGRARGAGLSLLLGTQELADLRLPGRERLGEQIMGNLTTVIAHRQVVPDSTAFVASLAGTHGVWRTSRHSDGRSTRTRALAGVLDPGEITALTPGWAAVIVLARPAATRLARIFCTSGG